MTKSLHASLQRTFEYKPIGVKPVPTTPPEESELHLKYGFLRPESFYTLLSDIVTNAPFDKNLSDWLTASLFRKRPVPGYHLTLLVTAKHRSMATVPHIIEAIQQVSWIDNILFMTRF